MQKSKYVNNFEKFEEFDKYIKELFDKLGYRVETNEYKLYKKYYDFSVSKNDKIYDVNVSYSKSKKVNKDLLMKEVLNLDNLDHSNTSIIITTGVVLGTHVPSFSFKSELLIIDIVDLLYIVQDNETMKNRLAGFVDFNINEIDITETEVIKELKIKKIPKEEIPYNEYIDKLNSWKNSTNYKKNSDEFEKLCTEILEVLFLDDLALWRIQKKSNRDLYRFDLVCRIKDNITTGFWNLLENRFNSKYIIFEYKNYSKKITQKEIYTTEKYLYLKALRSVAIIISRKGADSNAEIAMKGCLRENGKLIISITIDDLIKMLNEKSKGLDPSEYLYDILDNMLLDLEK